MARKRTDLAAHRGVVLGNRTLISRSLCRAGSSRIPRPCAPTNVKRRDENDHLVDGLRLSARARAWRQRCRAARGQCRSDWRAIDAESEMPGIPGGVNAAIKINRRQALVRRVNLYASTISTRWIYQPFECRVNSLEKTFRFRRGSCA